jgi:hypothetical protein
MRRFTREVVKSWPIGPLIGLEREAKPFPGRFPTRVWIMDQKGRIDYFGKPGLQTFRRYEKFLTARDWYKAGIRIYEFDRAGLVAYMDVTQSYYPLGLWQKYHPGRPGPQWDGLFLSDVKPTMKKKPAVQPEHRVRWEFVNGNAQDPNRIQGAEIENLVFVDEAAPVNLDRLYRAVAGRGRARPPVRQVQRRVR